MGIRFVFGGSGSGKSHYVYQKMIEKSLEAHEKYGLSREKILFVVPDQFTMQNQKELVLLHPRNGIMNIDVLSFSRFCHRIMEEVGGEPKPVLDDTGKSLIIKKVAQEIKDQLPHMGSMLKKQGYIHEVKSAISEFMQYGLPPKEVDRLVEYSQKRGALSQKLMDLQKIYQAFLSYIENHFITTEETLEVTRNLLKETSFVQGSTVVFDGFTGFTPIQNRFILELNRYVKEIVITLTLGDGYDPYRQEGEQNLFYLTRKAVASLVGETTRENRKETDVFLPLKKGQQNRFYQSPNLQALEQNLFRTRITPVKEEPRDVHIFSAESPGAEVHRVGIQISNLIKEKKLQYRDIGVIVSNMEEYAPLVDMVFQEMDIPCFLDQTRRIALNPAIEFIRSAFTVYLRDFSQDGVMQFLKSGLSGFSPEEVDEMENYLIATGIRGKSRWERSFTRKTKRMEGEEELSCLNDMREKILLLLAPLDGEKSDRAENLVRRLYTFLTNAAAEEKLFTMAGDFAAMGDANRSAEYKQIFGKIVELLEQVHDLLQGEILTIEEFYEILDAGIQEIKIGMIPQNVDRVLVGDMERTRMPQMKIMFCLGVNEGYIPKGTNRGGIISDMDREFLKESGIELSPTPRQQMFIQRLYLYMNLTRPSGELYLSFTERNNEGKALRPSYLIKSLQRIFPKLVVEDGNHLPLTERIISAKEGLTYLAGALREYADLGEKLPDIQNLYSIYQVYRKKDYENILEKIEKAAFFHCGNEEIAEHVAGLLYGWQIEASISRMENYAACAYQYFLEYGLALEEREEFSFETVDLGNIFHEVLRSFSDRLRIAGYQWFNFPEEWGRKNVEELVIAFSMEYGAGVLHSTARNEYHIKRMTRILQRTVETLKEQLKKGSFQPRDYEMEFKLVYDLADLKKELPGNQTALLRGRVDRVDLAEEEDKVYVKVIDYKSGEHRFDLVALYYGLQLQLVTYLDVAMEKVKKQYPQKEVIPGAMLYYHVTDPVVEDGNTEEEIHKEILKKLKMHGIVNGDNQVIRKLDHVMEDKSDVIPVEFTKSGSFGRYSEVMSKEDIRLVSRYVSEKIKSYCKEILSGKIRKNPYKRGETDACRYCTYKEVCGFDPSLPGYEKRKLKEMDEAQTMERIRKEAESWE